MTDKAIPIVTGFGAGSLDGEGARDHDRPFAGAALAPNGDVYVATESNTLYRWDGHSLMTVLAGGPIGQAVGCVAERDGNV
jgi:hypothetical protein